MPHLACVLMLALLGLGFRLSRRKGIIHSREATAAVEKHPWAHQFPPSRRHTLAGLKLKGSTDAYKSFPVEVLRKRAVPSTRTTDWDQDDLYTPTGFSTQDIRALGRFPDYSVLTGVRYPMPYGPQFDINKAIFRPFRPFRWSYHQTMGKLHHLLGRIPDRRLNGAPCSPLQIRPRLVGRARTELRLGHGAKATIEREAR